VAEAEEGVLQDGGEAGVVGETAGGGRLEEAVAGDADRGASTRAEKRV
jgi:hypothetical protein